MGVFLLENFGNFNTISLPHVRGGVSVLRLTGREARPSSPRAWGCFLLHVPVLRVCVVFPTCVGVFPARCQSYRPVKGLPHVRGGVSFIAEVRPREIRSSPRAWGCFLRGAAVEKGFLVFPTCVGVFPLPFALFPPKVSLPHVRGGVSSLCILNASL